MGQGFFAGWVTANKTLYAGWVPANKNLLSEVYFAIPSSYQVKSQHFLWDMNNTKWCNDFYIEFRQSFAKETFSYDEYLKS